MSLSGLFCGFEAVSENVEGEGEGHSDGRGPRDEDDHRAGTTQTVRPSRSVAGTRPVSAGHDLAP